MKLLLIGAAIVVLCSCSSNGNKLSENNITDTIRTTDGNIYQ